MENNKAVIGEKRHPLVCVDSGTEKYYELDGDGNIVFEMPLPGPSFDVWVLPDGNIAVPVYGRGKNGFTVFTRSGEILREHYFGDGVMEIFSLLPLQNGTVVLGDVRGKRLIHVAPDGTVAHETPIFYDGENIHEAMRSVRLSRDGKSFWVVQPGLCEIVKYSPDGDILERIPTRRDTFDVIEREDGALIYSSIEGIFTVDRRGNELFAVLPEMIPEVSFKWGLGMKMLADGNLIVANWLGHGHDGEGVPLFELSADGRVVWMCDVRDRITKLSNFYLL